MTSEQKDSLLIEAEALADGYLSDDRAKALDRQFHTEAKALSRMFDVARMNAALRKSQLHLYRDLSLAREVSRLRGADGGKKS
ncbi:hypothetical protein [Hyphococcus sp.]|uniref:hypothetical protein n=1 Tax=Hyphococcus sp. TaxID=2038636 RepID=UPI0035C6C6B7